MPKNCSSNSSGLAFKTESCGFLLSGVVKKEYIDSKGSRMSNEILSLDLNMTHLILLYYSKSHKCCKLMNKLSPKTRSFWNSDIEKMQTLFKKNNDTRTIELHTHIAKDLKYDSHLFKNYIIKTSIFEIEQMVKKMKKINERINEYHTKLNKTKGSPLNIHKVLIHKKDESSQDVDLSQMEIPFNEKGKSILMNLCKLARLCNAKPLNAKCKTSDGGEIDCADFGKAIEFTDFCGISLTSENKSLKIIAMNILNKVIIDEFYLDKLLELNSNELPNQFTGMCLMDLFDQENVRFKYLGMSNCKTIYMDLLQFQKSWSGNFDKKMNALFKSCEELHIKCFISHYKIIVSIYNFLLKIKESKFYLSINCAKKMVCKKVNPRCRVVSLVKYSKSEDLMHEIRLESKPDSKIIFNEIHYLNTQKEIPDCSGYFISDQFKIDELRVLSINVYTISEDLPLHLQHALGWFIDTNQCHSCAIMQPVPNDLVEIIVAPVWQKEYCNAAMKEKTQISLGFKLKNIFTKLVEDLKNVNKYKLIAEIDYKNSKINSSRIKAFERAIEMMGNAFEVRKIK